MRPRQPGIPDQNITVFRISISQLFDTRTERLSHFEASLVGPYSPEIIRGYTGLILLYSTGRGCCFLSLQPSMMLSTLMLVASYLITSVICGPVPRDAMLVGFLSSRREFLSTHHHGE